MFRERALRAADAERFLSAGSGVLGAVGDHALGFGRAAVLNDMQGAEVGSRDRRPGGWDCAEAGPRT
jgi:hypothetical protein